MYKNKGIITSIILSAALAAAMTGCSEGSGNSPVDTMVIEPITTEATTEAPTETTTETETEATTVLDPLVVLDSMQPYYEQNPDTVGWITIDGTNIDDVVLQGEDNDFYLDHDFFGKSSKAGSIYVDYRCTIDTHDVFQSDNIIIYGHNQADGSMFGTLSRYKIKQSNTSRFNFYLEHPTFKFSNLYEEYDYKIVALFVIEALPEQVSDGDFFDYHNYINFSPEKRPFEEFVERYELRSAIITGVDVQEGDKFITLSTCSNEFEPSRFVVIGRRVRDGEDPSVDTSKAQINTNAREPDWNFIYG